MHMNAANIAAMGTVMAVVITLLVIVGTGIHRLGELSNQVQQLATREEVRILVAEEIRRSNQQLFHALANHTHDADGDAVYSMPPGIEPTGANPNQQTPVQ